MRFLYDFEDRIPHINQSSTWSQENSLSLVNLFNRPYWYRIWIIQEVLQAQDLIVVCGNQKVKWQALENLSKMLERLRNRVSTSKSNSYIGDIIKSPAKRIIDHRQRWNSFQPDYSIKRLIEEFYTMESTNTLDMVYALQGLVTNPLYETQPDVTIDYSKSNWMLYREIKQGLLAARTMDSDFDSILRQCLKIPTVLSPSVVSTKLDRIS
jgi:hypothetical protein